MRFLFVVFFSFFTLFISSCFFDDEEKRESITMGLSPKGMYELGETNIDAGTIDEAIKIWEQLQAAYPASKYSIQSRLDTAYNLYKKERYDEASAALEDYIKRYPDHFSTPYAYYLRAIVSESKSKSILDEYITDNAQRDISSVKQAFNLYLDLIETFPSSKYTEEAKSNLAKLRNILARHELFVAIFYAKNDAFVASIKRCKFIIEKFPNTPSVPAALHLMAFNYEKIGATDLSKDARRVLELSYPKYIPHYTLEN